MTSFFSVVEEGTGMSSFAPPLASKNWNTYSDFFPTNRLSHWLHPCASPMCTGSPLKQISRPLSFRVNFSGSCRLAGR